MRRTFPAGSILQERLLTPTSDEGREGPPPALAPHAEQPVAIGTFVLPNGMQVVTVARNEFPIAVVRFVTLGAAKLNRGRVAA